MRIKQIFENDFPNNLEIDFYYRSEYYYETKIDIEEKLWLVSLNLRKYDKPFIHNEKEKLFSDYKENAEYYTALNDSNDQIAWMSIGKVKWKKTARLWDIYINKSHLRQGIGSKLLKLAEQRAKYWKCRAVEIETQTSNYNAIQFYQKYGYSISGLDTICYTNNDIKRNEVRIELTKKL